jgi:hypothetical protein
MAALRRLLSFTTSLGDVFMIPVRSDQVATFVAIESTASAAIW